jgi:hypothetical protein
VFWQSLSTLACWFVYDLAQCRDIYEKFLPPIMTSQALRYMKPEFYCFEVIKSCPGESPYKVMEVGEYVERLIND